MDLFSAVGPEDMRRAQIFSTAALALFIGSGVVPGLRPYANRIRLVLLVFYVLACAGFVAYVLLR